MFCTACPAAPLTRLSIALTTTARPPAGSNRTADVAIVGALHSSEVGHLVGLVNAHKRLVLVTLPVNGYEFHRAVHVARAEVSRLQNAAVHGKQVSGESEILLLQPRRKQHLRDVAVGSG